MQATRGRYRGRLLERQNREKRDGRLDSEVDDEEGVGFGVVGGVFEGDAVGGEAEFGGVLHEAVDENEDGLLVVGRGRQSDLGGKLGNEGGEVRNAPETASASTASMR